MKVQLDIVSGFLNSGKTSLINNLIDTTYAPQEKIVVLQGELGRQTVVARENVIVISWEQNCTIEFFKKLFRENTPSWLVIEWNGLTPIEPLLKVLRDKRLKQLFKLNALYHLLDVSIWDLSSENSVGEITREQIRNTEIIVLTNTNFLSKEKEREIRESLRQLNRLVDIEYFSAKCSLKPRLGKLEKFFFLAALVFFLFQLIRSVDLSEFDFSLISGFNTLFLSILIQAFPFLLLGTVISSFIQIFISEDFLKNFLPPKLGMITAAFLGLLFPVCDCSTIPIASSLMKKGVGVAETLTFMLVAPIVNPISLLATWYAFPTSHQIVFYRVFWGLIIAWIVSLLFSKMSKDDILLDSFEVKTCSCSHCNSKKPGLANNIETLFEHSALEFIMIGKYLVLAAFLSAFIYTFFSTDFLVSLGQWGKILSLLIMMFLGFILSLCSTSDAFIARTFVQQVSLGSILGFLVLGPMLDLKNIFLLLGNFKKKFVLKLTGLVWLVSFSLLAFNVLVLGK